MRIGRRSGKATPTAEEQLLARFRDLYTRMLMQTGFAGCKAIGISSAISGEGKTVVANRLATTLAGDGVFGRHGEVLLLDCNPGAPWVAGEHGVAETPGLLELLAGECALEVAIKPTATPGLSIMPAGGPAHAFPILIRTAMGGTFDQLRERFACIVVDLPSVLSSTDTAVLAGLTDQLILVVRAAVTSTKLVTQALDQLDQEKVLGIVLNDHRPRLPAWIDNRL